VRVASALVLAPLALAAVWYGRPFFNIMVAGGAALLAFEWTRLCGHGRFGPAGWGLAAGLVATVAAASLGFYGAAFALVGAASIGAALAVVAVGSEGRGWMFAGGLYLGLPCLAMIWLRDAGSSGRDLVLWLFLVVWATDIGAYAAGRLIGGPKLWKRVSPKKTWAGLAGGMACAAAVGAGLGFAAGRTDPGMLALAASGLAVIEQVGDFAESWVKRRFGAKDSGSIIPGHGGLFDRVDGLLFVGLMVALTRLMMGVDGPIG
jgi:phosphatidate cytidylyltransferase